MLNIIQHSERKCKSKTMRCHFTPTRKAIIKRHTIASIEKDAEKFKLLYLDGGNANVTTALENHLPVPQKVKHRVTICLSNSTPRHMPKRTKNICPTRTCTQFLIVAFFTIAKKMETTQISVNWWMDKQNTVYPYNGIKSIKRNEASIHATTWMSFKVC